MAEDQITSSQESLPLTPETFNLLLNMVNDDDLQMPLTSFGTNDHHALIAPPAEIVPPIPVARDSVPPVSQWPGDYNFTVSVTNNEKGNKNINWTYSEAENKLYVKKDAPCPINFSTNIPIRHGVVVRAMAVFTAPQHAVLAVPRCFNHIREELDSLEAEHLIRCESRAAIYHKDVQSQRYSVIVPYENPPDGQRHSTYIYKFVCYSSCSGGPNRKPLTLVFTLEIGNQVIGRCSVALKICASPGRDRESAEKQSIRMQPLQSPQPIHSTQPIHAIQPMHSTQPLHSTEPIHSIQAIHPTQPKRKKLITEEFEVLDYFKKRKSSSASKSTGPLTLTVEDTGCYDFLVQMKEFYEMKRVWKIVNKSMPNCFYLLTSSDESDVHPSPPQ